MGKNESSRRPPSHEFENQSLNQASMFATKSVATTSFALAETVNGRLAMLGFIAALGAEASSGETVFQQVGDAEPSILFAFIMFAAASLIPILRASRRRSSPS